MAARSHPLERTIVAGAMKAARGLGWLAYKMHGSQFGVAGLPDVLCIKAGTAVWLEAKRPGQRPTKIQDARMRELAEAGCKTAVICSAGEAKSFLEKLT